MSQNQVEITRDDMESFGEKLRALAESLTLGEQAVFEQIVRPPDGVSASGAEVEGYGLNVGVFNPFNWDASPYWIIGHDYKMDSPKTIPWGYSPVSGRLEARDHRHT
jgi:hypothetical protein